MLCAYYDNACDPHKLFDDLEISKAADHDHERDPRDEDQECGYPGLYAVCLRKACKTDTYAREKANDKAAHRVCFQITIQFVSRGNTRWTFSIFLFTIL